MTHTLLISKDSNKMEAQDKKSINYPKNVEANRIAPLYKLLLLWINIFCNFLICKKNIFLNWTTDYSTVAFNKLQRKRRPFSTPVKSFSYFRPAYLFYLEKSPTVASYCLFTLLDISYSTQQGMTQIWETTRICILNQTNPVSKIGEISTIHA